MEPNENASAAFHFDKGAKKGQATLQSKMDKRRHNFMKEHDMEDLKRKRDEQNVSLRKQAKQNKFAKNRTLKFPHLSDNEEKKLEKDSEYTVDDAQKAWHDGMDIMEYFQILSKTKFEIPHFLLLLELIVSKEDHKVLFGIVGLRKLLSLIDNPPIQNVIDANLLPILLTLISRSDFPRLQYEVLW